MSSPNNEGILSTSSYRRSESYSQEYDKEDRMEKAWIRKSGNQEVVYQVNRVSGLNIKIRSVYSSSLVVLR